MTASTAFSPLGAPRPTPHLTRSALHRCLQRHAISRLPEIEGDKPEKKRFASYAIGYFHIDIAEVRTEEGRLRLFVAVDRTSKFAFVRLVESAGKMEAAQFLRDLIKAVPYRVHTVLTDNGIQFTPRKQDIYDGWHIFDRVCEEHGIEHRLTKVNHPWTNGQVERMNRTIKAASRRDAAVKRYHYDSHDQLSAHLQLFVDAYNHARRLKTLRGLNPYEFVCQVWTKEPDRFRLDPSHHIPGPYTWSIFEWKRIVFPAGALSRSWVRKPERTMQSYSQDLRGRFLRAIAMGASARAAGRRFELSPTSAIRWAKAWRECGEQSARPRGRQPGQGAKLADHAALLLDLIEERRGITLHEVAERLVDERGITAAPSTIWRFYAQRGITFEKDRACRRAAACAGRRSALGLV